MTVAVACVERYVVVIHIMIIGDDDVLVVGRLYEESRTECMSLEWGRYGHTRAHKVDR